MSVADTIATDYLYIDGIETVTYADAAGNATSGVSGLRGGLNYRETLMAAGGAYQPNDMVWELWSATMSGEVPTAGAKVTDTLGAVYVVRSAIETAIGQTSIKWRCVCSKQEA
jgi:hypothetical protein